MLAFEQEQQRLEQLQRRWMVGVSEPLSDDLIPPSWLPLLQALPAERRSLMALALAAQQQSLLLIPAPSTTLTAAPLLPQLPHPTLPSLLRPLFRRVMMVLDKQSAISTSLLLQLLLQRGFTAHPADWLPSAEEDNLPAVYFPWCRWVTQKAVSNQRSGDESLSEDNWDEWYPAERVAQFKTWRVRDPGAARTLIERCAAREPADKRLKIVETLAVNLGDEDAPYLQQLLNDRSQKIAQLAAAYLSRLGQPLQTPNDTSERIETELATGYELKKAGLLRKRLELSPRKLKNQKQMAIRAEQLEKVSLPAFAEALGIDSSQLVQSWRFRDNRPHDNFRFVANVVNTLPDHCIDQLVQNLMETLEPGQGDATILRPVVTRLSQQRRVELVLDLLSRRDAEFTFHECLVLLQAPLPKMSWEQLRKTPAWKQLRSSITEKLQEDVYLDNTAAGAEIMALGLLLPQTVAAKAMDTLLDIGVMRADPMLDGLKLNAELEPLGPLNHRDTL